MSVQQPAEFYKKDLADAIAEQLHDHLVEVIADGDFYVKVGPNEETLSVGEGPGVGDLKSNQFQLLTDGDNGEDSSEGDYEEFQDVVVVTVQFLRRRVVPQD